MKSEEIRAAALLAASNVYSGVSVMRGKREDVVMEVAARMVVFIETGLDTLKK